MDPAGAPTDAASAKLGPAIVTAIGFLLAIAAALAPEDHGQLPGSAATRPIIALPDWLLIAVVAAFSAASLILIAILFPLRRGRRKKGEEEHELYYEPRRPPLAVALVLIVLALTPPGLIVASIVWADRNEILLHPRPAGADAEASPEPPAPTRQQPSDDRRARLASPVAADLLAAVAILVGFGSLAFMLWLRFGDRLRRPLLDDEKPRAQLSAAVEESLDDIRLEPDPRAAIIKCYRRFEHALAAARLPRPPWQTPVEFMHAALRELPLPSEAVAHITGLFQIARFSRHPVGAAEREDAWRSLVAIREALNREKEAADGTPA